MNEVRQKLTPAERAILSDLWENKDLLRSLQAALSHRQLGLAQFGTILTTDFEQVKETRGRISEDKWVMSFIKYNFEEGEKARKKAEQASQVEE
jgi:hypothetical protein